MKIDIPFFSEQEPASIRENSETIKSLLKSDELDAQQLLETVESREKLIMDFLQGTPDADKALIEDLIKTNHELTQVVNSFRTDQQKVLVNFLRTRKAIKKYQ